ncbi:MAG: DUF559 domain-containing protein [Streptosporangiaceae bacterium]|nr:DUF559 domain-containing protein [Streptosporangiaceae bacterium]
MTEDEGLRIALLWAGDGAALAGLTAARLEGLNGFTDNRIHILLPHSRQVRKPSPGLRVIVHRSRTFDPGEVHPARYPGRTRIARSLVDAASWMPSGRAAQGVLAAGVQQRLVRVEDLIAVTARNQRLRRRTLITSTLDDIAGGAHALSELDFTRLVIRRFRLPAPSRQVSHRDSRGRCRWLDACWDDAKLIAEIDGMHHMEPGEWADDMERENDLQLARYCVLRFPSFVVRYRPGHVAAKIRQALRDAGHRC